MVEDITRGFKLTSKDYENMTDLINPSELEDDEITIDSLSNKIIVIRQQLLGLENLLKKYINQTISKGDKNLDDNAMYYYAHGKRWEFVNGQLVISEEQLELELGV